MWGNWLTDGEFKSFKVPRASQSVGRTLEEYEVKQLLEAAQNKRDRALVAVMAATGARLGEIERMKWEDLKDAHIVLPSTKARKPRIVGLDPRTLEYLRLYKVMANDHPQRAMWQKLSNLDDISAAGIRAVIKKVARVANVPNVTHHSFRRFFATASLGKGMPVESLRRLLGHSSYAMVRRYASLSDKHLLSDYGRFGPFSEREENDE